jgi:NADPH-dependent curcumin reductase CurA
MAENMKRIVLVRRPEGAAQPSDFRLEQVSVPEPREGEVLIANRLLAMDPAIRGFLDDRPSYLPPIEIGETVRGMVLGEVLTSRNPDLPVGTIVRALAGWAEKSILGPDALGLEPLKTAPGVALDSYMGALGPSGLTAWVGLHEIGRIESGNTVLVSAALGAVGSVVCQIAKLRGCRVIGLVGNADKCAALRGLGVDEAIDYRTTPDLSAAIAAAAPDGIDVYFDNVGGTALETAMSLMNDHGRIVVCGMIGDYDNQDSPYPVKTLWQMVVKRLTMRGFLTYDHQDRLEEASRDLNEWVAQGKLRPIESVYSGIEQSPQAFIDMMSGRTTGKALVRLG